MWQSIQQKLHKLIDLIDVPSMLGLSAILAEIKDVLGILGLIITVSYTLWKWRKELKDSKLRKNESKS